MGYTIGYQHYWNEKWSSYVMYNYGANDTSEDEPDATIKAHWSIPDNSGLQPV